MKKLIIIVLPVFLFAVAGNSQTGIGLAANNTSGYDKYQSRMQKKIHRYERHHPDNPSSGTVAWKSPASLPMIENFIPVEVKANLLVKYGSSLYDITKIAGAGLQEEYVVRIMNNDQLITEKLVDI